jgi:hypothetical protein
MSELDNVKAIWERRVQHAQQSGQLPRSWGAVALDTSAVADETGMGYGYTGDPDDLREALEDRDERAAAEAEDEEIDLLGEETVLRFRHPAFPDGALRVAVPPMTLGRIDMFNRLQLEAEKMERTLANTSLGDRAIVKRAADAKQAKKAMLLFAVPDFPEQFYDDMPAKAFVQMMKVLNGMKDEALGVESGEGGRPNR